MIGLYHVKNFILRDRILKPYSPAFQELHRISEDHPSQWNKIGLDLRSSIGDPFLNATDVTPVGYYIALIGQLFLCSAHYLKPSWCGVNSTLNFYSRFNKSFFDVDRTASTSVFWGWCAPSLCREHSGLHRYLYRRLHFHPPNLYPDC